MNSVMSVTWRRAGRLFGPVAVAVIGALVPVVGAPAAGAVAPPVEISVSSTPQTFSPNGDGQDDTVSVAYCLTRPANVTITVRTAAGATVRTTESAVSHPGQESCWFYGTEWASWDGRNDGGSVVTAGDYTIRIAATDSSGNTATADYSTAVDLRIPGAITQPAPNATVSGTAGFVFTPTSPTTGITIQGVYAGCLGASSAADPDGKWRGTGDTTQCDDGPTTVSAQVQWQDKFGASHYFYGTAIPYVINNPVRIPLAYFTPERSFSPNGDGQEDTLAVAYCLTRDATVTARVKNGAGTVVKTLLSDEAQTGSGAACGIYYSWSSSVEWDGTTSTSQAAPAGAYTVEITGVDSAGGTGSLVFDTAIDRRVPGTLTQPAAGATLTGTATAAVTPATPANGITVQGVAVDCFGSSPGPDGDGLWRIQADTTACTDGALDLHAGIQWTDQFGASHYYTGPAVPVTVNNPVRVSLRDQSRTFSPNGDGQEDSLVTYYCLSRPSDVTVTVRNASGTVVRTLLDAEQRDGSPSCGYYWAYVQNVEWDGRTDAGQDAPAGNYTIRIDAHDSAGGNGTVSAPTVVDRRVPASLTQPAANATLTGTVDYVVTPTSPTTGITITGVGGGCLGDAFTEQPNGTWTAAVDTTRCADGPTTTSAFVSWTDAFGSGHYYSTPDVAVTIDNPVAVEPVSVSGTGSGRLFSPDGDGQEDELVVPYCISRDSEVTVTVKNAGGATVRTLDGPTAKVGNPNCWWYALEQVTWDGTDAAGQPAPAGLYSIVISARDSSNHVAAATFPTEIDRRQPAALTLPANGDTLSGLARFEVTPTPGIQLSQSQLCLQSSGCFAIYDASPDGIWRTSAFTGSMTAGPTDLTWTVTFVDRFGSTHSFQGQSIPVTINTTAIPLTFTASPTTGLAPLTTSLRIESSDPTGQPLTYTLNFGDGQSTSGTITSPYAPVVVSHTYVNPSVYSASVNVGNGIGGTAVKSTSISVGAATNHPPVPALNLSTVVGSAPLSTVATFAATDVDPGNPLTYTLDWGDGSDTETGSLTSGVAKTAPHQFTGSGLYTVRFAVSDGQQMVARTASVNVGLAEELAARAGDDVTVNVGQSVTFDGSGSRPLVGIQSYTWNFGDGTGTATGATVSHAFTGVGTRLVTLTVRSGSSVSTDTVSVNVVPVPTAPGARVTVTGGGVPLPGADTAVIDADGVRYRATTDASGVATLTNLPNGTYTAYAFKSGYKPGKGQITVNAGNGAVTVDLVSGEIAQTELTSTRLTYEQIIDAGIDPNDPQNQNVFEFEVHLAFGPDEVPLTYSGIATGGGVVGGEFVGGSVGGGGCECVAIDGYTVYPQIEYVADQPTLVWMVIPGRAKWLKEFFEIRMLITNLADPDFTFENGSVSLGELPDGLTLAPTADPQELVQDLPDIPGGATESATWIVRGDTEGYYSLTADYSGTLEPLGVPLNLTAQTEAGALHVWGGSAIHMIVDVDDRADMGAPYRMRVGLQNVADVPVYNPEVELLTEGRVNYIYQPRERFEQGTSVIEAGETFWTDDYRLVPSITGVLDLAHSFVKKTAGNVDVSSTIVSHPQDPPVASLPAFQAVPVSGGGYQLTWAPVPGATSYEIFRTPNRDTDFGAAPIATVGGSTTSVTISDATKGYFAVSTVIGGVNTMFHRLDGTDGPVLPAGVTPSVTVGDISVAEGNSGQTTADVQVRLSAPSSSAVSLRYRTMDVMATAPGDYAAIPTTTLTFAPGETTATIPVTVQGDTVPEKAEYFALRFSDAVGATLSDTAANVRIIEDDGPLSISVADASVLEGNAGTATLSTTVSLSAPVGPGQSVKLKYRTTTGTATAGTDYVAVADTALTFGPGEQSKPLSFTVVSDTAAEQNETFSVLLTGIVGANVGDPVATATIVEDDAGAPVLPLPSVTIADGSVLEGDAGATPASLTARLSSASATPITVGYATVNGTARSGSDYSAALGTVTFAAGQVEATIPLTVKGDTARELTEWFTVRLANPAGAVVSDGSGKLTILGEEGPLSLSVNDPVVTEGNSGTVDAVFTLRLSEAPIAGETVTVRVRTADGSANAGSDYVAVPATDVVFAAGQSTRTIVVKVNGDGVKEPNEYVNLNVYRPVNVTLADSQGRGQIRNDDA